ncbi:MAG: hypothetical protein ACUVSM_14750 [Armatimonadota bacterium]
MSINGRIELRRVRFFAKAEGSEHPVDRLVDAVESVVSVAVRELCCQLGIAGRSFARSVKVLKDAAQIRLSEEVYRQVVESEGKAVLKASAQDQLEIDWSAGQCKTLNPSGQEVTRVYTSADGVLVPTTTMAEKQKRRATVLARRKQMPAKRRKKLKALGAVKKGSDLQYKQVYVSVFYDQDKTHRLVGLTRKDHRELGKLLKRDAARIHLLEATERVGLVDGAKCLRGHLEGLPLQAVVLDFRHLGEHVNDACRKTLGEGTEAGKAWSDDVLHTAKHEGYEPFFEKVVDWRSDLRGKKRKVGNDLVGYVSERRPMILYDECEKRGWDVGTGPMESMCGVTTDRIKGRGRRWDIDNAEAVMALEALYQSNLWDQYWDKALCSQN